MKKELSTNIKIFFCVIISLKLLIFGIILGIILQQNIYKNGLVEIAEALDGTSFNVEIDFNETKLVDRTFELFDDFIFENASQGDQINKCSNGKYSNNCSDIIGVKQ